MDQTSLRAEGPGLVGTARCGPACRVVWDLRLIDAIVSQSWGPDWPLVSIAFRMLSGFRRISKTAIT